MHDVVKDFNIDFLGLNQGDSLNVAYTVGGNDILVQDSRHAGQVAVFPMLVGRPRVLRKCKSDARGESKSKTTSFLPIHSLLRKLHGKTTYRIT